MRLDTECGEHGLVGSNLRELLVPTMGVITSNFEYHGDGEPPFAIEMNELAEYAMDKIDRRLGAIESARGRNLLEIDVDASPETLEEWFHVEDQAALAAA